VSDAGIIPGTANRPAGVVLAGGASTRMGRPKALLPFPATGESFLDRLIGILGHACDPVIVILGHGAAEVRNGLARAGHAQLVLNPDWPTGQLSSLQCGLRTVPHSAPGFLFIPVDHPAVSAATVAAVAAALARGATLAVPRFSGRRGHPAGCAASLIPEFLALSPGAQARDVIHRHAALTCYVDVEDPGILTDVDDPEAYQRLVETAAR